MQKITLTKEKYPTKRTINLAMTEYEEGNPRVQVLLFAVFLVALVLFTKFAVVDKLQAANAREAEYTSLAQQIDAYNDSTQDYDTVREEFSLYNSSFLSDGEAVEMDRMQVMDLLEKQILPRADVRSAQLSGNQLTVEVDNTNLNTISLLVSNLQSDERVSTVNVTTAGTGDEDQRVSASFAIVLKGEGGAGEE